MGNGSISEAHTGVIPASSPPNGKPPEPSNRLPRVKVLFVMGRYLTVLVFFFVTQHADLFLRADLLDVPLYDNIAELLIQFDGAADAVGLLTGNERRTGAAEGVKHHGICHRAVLNNECRLNNTQTNLANISELICRTLFCCVIDSMGLLMSGDVSLYVFAQKYTEESGSDFSDFMALLYLAMKQADRSNLPIHFGQVNYIDSRLFDKDISDISFTKNMRSLMLEIMSFDWSDVDPEILGSLIQSIIVPDNESITGNYTATANIQKVIGPLFLNDLYSEYENCKNESAACISLIKRIRKICVFDTSLTPSIHSSKRLK